MTPQLVGVFIPIFGMGLGLAAMIIGYKLKAQQNQMKILEMQRGNEAVDGEMARELQRLKDRVAVLEKLVTDDDRRLAGEIERLRGERTV